MRRWLLRSLDLEKITAKNLLKVLFIFFTLSILSCSVSYDGEKDDVLCSIVLTELYFMESGYGKERCDNFIEDREIIDKLKAIDPEITDDILNKAFIYRKKQHG